MLPLKPTILTINESDIKKETTKEKTIKQRIGLQ
jgi:hypothetical protein